MLDNDQCIAEVAEPFQRFEQSVIVPLVQPDARLVENIKHPHKTRTDLRRKPDALRLAAGKRSRRPRKRQIIQPHMDEESESRVDFLQNLRRDFLLPRRQIERRKKRVRVPDRQLRRLVDALAPHRHRQGLRFQPRAVADRARGNGHEILVAFPHLVAVRLAVTTGQERHHALKGMVIFLVLAVHILVAVFEALLPGAIEQDVPHLLFQLGKRRIHRIAVFPEHAVHLAHGIGIEVSRQRREHALRHGKRGIRHHQFLVELHLAADTAARGTRTVRIVERKHTRRKLRQADAAVDAGKILAEHQKLAVHHLHIDNALAELQRRFQRIGQPLANALAQHKTVNHDLDGVFLVLFQRHFLARVVNLPVHAHPHIAVAPNLLENLAVLALFPANHLRENQELCPVGERKDLVEHLIQRLLGNRLAALRAMRPPGPRVQKAQIIVNLRHRADGRPRVAARRFLVNGNRWGKPLDQIHVGLVHLPEELPRIRRQRLHIPPLPLGVNRIERQRRLPRTGKPRNDNQFIAGYLQIDIFQVMLPRPADANGIFHIVQTFLVSLKKTLFCRFTHLPFHRRNFLHRQPRAQCQFFRPAMSTYHAQLASSEIHPHWQSAQKPGIAASKKRQKPVFHQLKMTPTNIARPAPVPR